MHWAKQHVGTAPYCLGLSGVPTVPASEVPETPAVTEEPNYYGLLAFREAVARAHGVGPDSVLAAEGTSLANYTVLTAVAGPGERILVETPTYPVLAEIPRFHGAKVERLVRRPEKGWLPDLDDVARSAAGAGGRLAAVVLTRLHNPSGTELPRAFLQGLARLAERHDFHVVLDEVYLDFLESPVPGHRFSPRFVSTGSLTKVYGFGPLRAGWIVGDPQALAPIRELSFYLAVDGPWSSQLAGAKVLDSRDALRTRARALSTRGLRVLEEWVRTRPDVQWTRPDGGIVALVRLTGVEDTARFAAKLFRERGVTVAAGEFFGSPGWVRIGVGGAEQTIHEALHRLGEALDEHAAQRRAAG
jgi:aspartate/methionine/tyrosine aminotransferase